MNKGFKEEVIVKRETAAELLNALSEFESNMKKFMEKYDGYSYTMETLGGKSGSHKAKVIVTKDEENRHTEENTSAHGVL